MAFNPQTANAGEKPEELWDTRTHTEPRESLSQRTSERPTLIIETNEREPIARVLLAEVTLVVGLSDENGEPQGPYNVEKVILRRQDPEGAGRDLVQQYIDLLAKSEAAAVKQWKER